MNIITAPAGLIGVGMLHSYDFAMGVNEKYLIITTTQWFAIMNSRVTTHVLHDPAIVQSYICQFSDFFL